MAVVPIGSPRRLRKSLDVRYQNYETETCFSRWNKKHEKILKHKPVHESKSEVAGGSCLDARVTQPFTAQQARPPSPLLDLDLPTFVRVLHAVQTRKPQGVVFLLVLMLRLYS